MVKEANIFTIVVTYNAMPWLETCFDRLKNVTLNNHKIIAVDNASTDETVEIIKKKYPKVVLIETGQNLGFGKANNIGLKKALEEKADYVFLLNQDAWIEHDTLNKLINISIKNPDFGIISPVHMNNEEKIDSEFLKYCYLNLNSEFTFDSILVKPFKKIYETPFINAAAWLITKKCLLTNGGFMPIFPHYGEDGNYCERVINSGLKIGFTPEITIIHDRNVKKRKLSFSKKVNRLYIYCLSIFTSVNYKGKNNKMFIKQKTILLLKIYIKQPMILFSLPVVLGKIIVKYKQIKTQRKESLNNNANFLV